MKVDHKNLERNIGKNSGNRRDRDKDIRREMQGCIPEKEINRKRPSRNELLAAALEEIFREGMVSGKKPPVFGVIEINPDRPAYDGCEEKVFQLMLADLNAMMRVIMKCDRMMKMVCEEVMDPEDARCITLLGIWEGREILKKWIQLLYSRG